MTPEQILGLILNDFGLEILDKTQTEFYCNCSKERVTKALISVGKQEMRNIVADGKPIDVNCHFCNTSYHFELDELQDILLNM